MKHIFLPFTPDDCVLRAEQIDIWQYPLDMDFKSAHSLLSFEEQKRANNYHFAHHQARFTQARAMLRLILSKYTQINPKKISWIENKYGKPQLYPCSDLHFNLSHSKNMAILAIGKYYPLGVDIEFFANRAFDGIAHIMFSDQEQNALHQVHESTKPLAFYHVWAQKEAFIKACGVGLQYPTKSFNVPVLPTKTHMIIDTQTNTNWHMTSFMPQVGCCAAVCYHPDVVNIRYLAIEEPYKMGL